MAIKDGAPAFPGGERWRTVDLAGNEENYSRAPFQRGLSLRDYFAAKAMQGILSGPCSRDGVSLAEWADVPVHAYAIADAMLAAREAHP